MKLTKNDYQAILKHIKEGTIRKQNHPEYPNIQIFNYTEKATFEKVWDKYTMMCRGLILDTNELDDGSVKILAKPFDKFPNYNSNEIPNYEDDIDFTSFTAVEKMDGSIGISYFLNGELKIASKGSFNSEQANKANELLKTKYSKAKEMIEDSYSASNEKEKNELNTFIFEIIYPENRIVVDYGEEESLVLLGYNSSKNDYIYIDFEEEFLDVYAELLEFERPKTFTFNSLNDVIEARESLTMNEEGYILRFPNNKRLKIKGEEYLQVHRVLSGISKKAKFVAWRNDKLDEIIFSVPEEFRKELEEFKKNMNEVLEKRCLELSTEYVNIMTELNKKLGQGKAETKDVAKIVNNTIEDKATRGLLIRMFFNKGKINLEKVKEHIAKGYRDYNDDGTLKEDNND